MARPTTAVVLDARERAALATLAEDSGLAEALRRPARIVLLLAEGVPGSAVARQLGTSPQTVCAWRHRFLRHRLAALPARTDGGVEAPAARTAAAGEPPLQPVTLQHIAELVGVHKSTVHRILRREPALDGDLARRIRTAARDLGYRPEANHSARQLALRRFHRRDERRVILFYQHSGTFHSPFHLRQFTGAMDVLANSRFDVLVRLADSLADRQLPMAVERGEVAAVVSQDCTDWMEIQQSQLAHLHPTVRPALIGMLRTLPGTWSVGVDFAEAGRQLIGRLLDLGHRRFIAIEQRDQVTAGLRAGLRERGLDPESALRCMHAVPSAGTAHERIGETLRLLLAAQPQATACIACNDPTALVAAELFAQWGMPVPQAMSVTGFDGTHDGPQAGWLASVTLPLEDIGRATARLAMDPGPTPRDELLPAAFRDGASIAPPPAG